MSAQKAKRLANAHLRRDGSHLVAHRATMNKEHEAWVVSYCDPATPNQMLVGGALVVTSGGTVHSIGSQPDAVDVLMTSLGRDPALGLDAWSREGEGLALLADLDIDEAEGVAAMADFRRPWPNALADEVTKSYFKALMKFVDEERRHGAVYPPPAQVFAAFRLTPIEQVRVVILGQDPYPQPHQANGLCFSVSRDQTKLPTSLRNIHKAMENDGLRESAHGDLSVWAAQGVLLLNTSLSVRHAEANSHKSEWREFTDRVISLLSEQSRSIVFVLWGRDAQRKRSLIDESLHEVVTAPHPASRGHSQREFRNVRTLSKVNRILEGRQERPIDWALT